MRLVSLLIGLLLVGLLIIKQLGSSSSNDKISDVTSSESNRAPKVSASPKDLLEFEQDMDKFVLDNAEKRAKELEESLDQ